ncbi:hypothetical protein ACF09E_34945 [Streptomyces sp. NPDC014891]|uniref:hypothetical protein n=1 Tax=Streptomyces sp. NPDC014891 TaxID=3364929 RepID=UPI003701949C
MDVFDAAQSYLVWLGLVGLALLIGVRATAWAAHLSARQPPPSAAPDALDVPSGIERHDDR